MADVLVVATESLWPPVDGGRLRTARLAEVLGERFDVVVVAPEGGAAPPPGLAFRALPDDPPLGRLPAIVSHHPRLGSASLGPRRREALSKLVDRHRPGRVLFAHGYLAAVAPPVGVPSIVDFGDVEVRRQASLSRRGSPRNRAAAGWEAAKARRWEPRLARRVELALASTADDEQVLAAWGATVLLVPNGADRHRCRPSPADGPVTFVASHDYPPNADAARFLLEQVWPLLRRMAPGIRLRLVGQGAARAIVAENWDDGVEVVSDPDDVGPYYDQASLVVAPVVCGGGAQLKVTEALARGRLVVATPYSARSAPAGSDAVIGAVIVAEGAQDLGTRVATLWRDVDDRWARERRLVEERPVPTWREVCTPLLDVLERVGSRP